MAAKADFPPVAVGIMPQFGQKFGNLICTVNNPVHGCHRQIWL